MPTFFVVLDACGEVVDFLKLKNFLKRKNSYWGSEKLDKVYILMFSPLCKINDLATQWSSSIVWIILLDVYQEADIEKLNNFLVKHQPDVIAVPASCRYVQHVIIL